MINANGLLARVLNVRRRDRKAVWRAGRICRRDVGGRNKDQQTLRHLIDSTIGNSIVWKLYSCYRIEDRRITRFGKVSQTLEQTWHRDGRDCAWGLDNAPELLGKEEECLF